MLDAAHALEGAIGFSRDGMEGGVRRRGMTDDEVRVAATRRSTRCPIGSATKLGKVAVIVEEVHPTDDLMGIYDPIGGLHRIVVFRAAPERRERPAHGMARGRPPLRHGRGELQGLGYVRR